MKKIILRFLFLMIFVQSLFSARDVYRYGIFVASSKGYNENDLPRAGKLVKEVASLFSEYCLLDETVLFEDPGKEALNAAFDLAKETIAEQGRERETQFFFYYYGHGMPEGLLLDQRIYLKSDLKEKVAAIDAQLKFVFLDACSSQVLNADDKLDFNTDSEGTVFITSSTQFQKAFTDVFTPILKAGLMGDADGFIPQQIDASFFYHKIVTKLARKDQELIRSLYGLSEYYQYRHISEEDTKRLETLFTALGADSIPENIHITDLESQVLNRVDNPEDEKIILESYNYTQTCSLKEQLSKTEEARLLDSLEKAGFKKDNFVTLSELFSYIQTRVAEKNINGQRPTITTSYLSFSEPVRLAYFEHKIGLHLKYPGTIFVKKVGEDSVLEHIVKIVPTLDEGEPVNLSLKPGSYRIIIETDQAKYAIDVELKPGESPVLPETLEWSNLIAYRQGEQWLDKEVLDKKIKIYKKTAWVPPFVTFTSFAIPLSFLFTEIGYTNYLLYQYNAGDDPDQVGRLRDRLVEFEKIRNNFYIAAGVCFAIPIIPFVIWMVRVVQVSKLKKKMKTIKSEVIFSYLPDITVGQKEVAVAFNIKL